MYKQSCLDSREPISFLKMDFFKDLKLSEKPENTQNITRWSTSPVQLQGSSRSYLKSEFREIHDLFNKTCQDNDFDGRISLKHLKVILKTLNLDENLYDVNEIIGQLDPNKEGFVYLTDLSEVITMRNKDKCSENDLRRAFQLMDENGKGFLTLNDLKKINDEIGEKMSEEELQEMMDEADVSDAGVVTEDNFVKFMMKAQEDAVKCNCV